MSKNFDCFVRDVAIFILYCIFASKGLNPDKALGLAKKNYKAFEDNYLRGKI